MGRITLMIFLGVGLAGLLAGLSSPVFAQPQEPAPEPALPPAADSIEAAGETAPVSPAASSGSKSKVAMTVEVEGADGRRTPLGTFVIELLPGKAPRHAANFLKLVESGFYTGTTFHRIVPAFIVQGGDPIGKTNWKSSNLGTGGPDYTIAAEIGEKHTRGAVAAARKPDSVNPSRASSGSQFFICLADLPALDNGGYSVFGQVVEGMDVIDRIARVKNAGPPKNQALQRVEITALEIRD